MLRPTDTTPRTALAQRAVALRPRRRGRGRAEGWWNRPLPADARCRCRPATTTSFADAAVRDHVGDVWYQTTSASRAAGGERIVLRFDAATHRAVVWVDDAQVAEHEGGYTPFEADVTDVVEPGAENRITVVVNNELYLAVDPARATSSDTRTAARQRYFHDFFNYAGLHRTVWLYTTPATHVERRHRRDRPRRLDRDVGYGVETSAPTACEVDVALRDADGARSRGRGRRRAS